MLVLYEEYTNVVKIKVNLEHTDKMRRNHQFFKKFENAKTDSVTNKRNAVQCTTIVHFVHNTED